MDSEHLDRVIEHQYNQCRELLVIKAREYSPTDRLHNFRVAAKTQGVTLEQAIAGMMAKHTVGLYDLIKRSSCGEQFSSDIWVEKITDHMNYLFLLKAVLVEQWDATGDMAGVTVKQAIEDMGTSIGGIK